MKFTTLQEIFNTAYRGLAKQGFKQSLDENGDCMYRSPDGLKCAIGHCISDKNYNSKLEDLDSFNFKVRKTFIKDESLPEEQHYALLQIQSAHDDGKKPKNMKAELKAIAKNWNLTVPKVDDGI